MSGMANLVAEGPPSLVRWGLSPAADLVYRALLRSGPSTANGVQHHLGMAAGRVAEAIAELVATGAVRSQPGTARQDTGWVAVPVSTLSTTLAATLRRDRPHTVPLTAADRHRRTRHLVPDVLGDEMRHLPSRALTRTRLAELNAVVGHEHLASNPEPIFAADMARPAVAMDRMVLSRGVPMRVLGVHGMESDPMVQHGREPQEASPRYRVADEVPMKLIVVDRKVALFPVDPGDLERGYLEVSQASVVSALVALFEEHWQSAREAPQPLPRINLSPRERALVTLLAEGLSDADAAERLKLSRRSVTYTLRGLMDQLGVENRFQLGLALGAAGVVDPATGHPYPTDPYLTTPCPTDLESK